MPLRFRFVPHTVSPYGAELAEPAEYRDEGLHAAASSLLFESFFRSRLSDMSVRRVAAAALCLALTAGGCAALDEQQRRWVFQPSRDTWGGAMASDGMLDRWIEFDSKVDER